MKRGYTVCFRKAFGDAANTQTYIVRAFFVRLTLPLLAVAQSYSIYEEVVTLCAPSFGAAVWVFL